MKQHLQVTPRRNTFLEVPFKGLVMVVFALLCLGIALPSAAQTATAQLRVGHFVFDAPAVNLYVNESAITGKDSLPTVFGSMTLPTEYLDFAASAHSFAVAADGSDLKSALIAPQSLTLEADHHYLLAILGNAAAGDLHFNLIDETAALARFDVSESAVSILVNNVYGVPALDMSFANKMVVNNLVYGDYFISQDSPEGKGSLVTVHNDPAAVVFQYDDAVGSPGNVFAVFVFSGKFPGTMGQDYTPYYVGQYVGNLTIVDGGSIKVGDSVPVNITDMGQRVHFTLDLSTNSTLDIVQSTNDTSSSADALLRIKNMAGDTLYENDELPTEDNSQGTLDAGWKNLTLDAGTYTVEAGTFVDMGTGAFTLSVSLP